MLQWGGNPKTKSIVHLLSIVIARYLLLFVHDHKFVNSGVSDYIFSEVMGECQKLALRPTLLCQVMFH